jgi:hypothetical protein
VDSGEHYQAMVAASRRTAHAYGREEAAGLLTGFWRRFLAG